MADAKLSGKTPVAIVETFAAGSPYRTIVENLSRHKRASVNTDLMIQGRCPSGIYIGGDGNYKLFVMDIDGDVVPYLQIAGGVVHPIQAKQIMKDVRYTTDAPNVLVIY